MGPPLVTPGDLTWGSAGGFGEELGQGMVQSLL